jgi:hypothetical protein
MLGYDVKDRDPYMPNPSAFRYDTPTEYFTGSGDLEGGTFFTEHGAIQDPDTGEVDAWRGLAEGSRSTQDEALRLLQMYASGQKSQARQSGDLAAQRAQDAIMSRGRSSPGAINPAAMRAARHAASGVGQSMAGDIAEAALRERMAAERMATMGLGRLRGYDMKQQGFEQDWFGRQSQHEAMQANLMAQYLGMGLQAQQAAQQSLADREALRVQADQQARADAYRRAAEKNANSPLNLILGLASAGGAGLGSAAMSGSGKDD